MSRPSTTSGQQPARNQTRDPPTTTVRDMTGLDRSDASWRKSSRSGPQGGDCVEAAALWRISSHSANQGGDCVEAAALPEATVGLRDSKNPGGGHLHLSVPAWRGLLSSIKSG